MKAGIIGLVQTGVLMAIIGSIMEGIWLGGSQATTLQTLLSPPTFNFTNAITGIVSIYQVSQAYVAGFWTLLWWDFPFFEGQWLILKWIMWFPVSIGLLYGFVTMITRRA